MDLAPYALVRVAGLPFDVVEQLGASGTLAVARELDGLERALHDNRDGLCERLFRAARDCDDASQRRAVLDVKRAVFNHRMPRSAAAVRVAEPALRGHAGLLSDLCAWQHRVRRRDELAAAGERAVQQDVSNLRRCLATLWAHPALQNGVLFAQPHLFDQLAASSREPAAAMPNRLLGVLAAYCHRAATKTSPFSTFTATGVCRVDEITPAGAAASIGHRSSSRFTLNAAVIDTLDSLLKSHEAIGREIPLHRNDTAEVVGDEVAFIATPRTAADVMVALPRDERLLWVQRDPLVDLVLALLTDRLEPQTLASLVHRVAGKIRDPQVRDLVSDAIERLAAVGLVHPSLNYDAGSPYALASLAAAPALAVTPAGAAVRSHLQIAQAALAALEEASPVVRRRLLADVRREVGAAMDAAGGMSSALRQQGLVHHDAYLRGASVSGHRLRELLPPLARLQAMLPLFNVDLPYRAQVQGWARSREGWDTPGGVSLMTLYRDFCESNPPEAGPLVADLEQRQHAVAAELRQQATREESVVDLPADVLARAAEAARPYAAATAAHSVGYLGQLWSEASGALRFVVNHVLPGYGALVARAAAEEGQARWLVDALQSARRRVARDAEVVDLVGTFGFDGQLHPPLSALRLVYPGESARREADAPLRWCDVHAAYDPSCDAVRLRHGSSGPWLLPLAAGTLGPGLLPPFFRFTLSFGPAFLPDLPMVDLLDETATAPERDEVRHYARLQHAGVVWSRETWCVPAHVVPPAGSPGDFGDFADFRRLRTWASALGLPQQVFVTPSRPGHLDPTQLRGKRFRRLHKPFFVDWDDLVSHWNFRRFTRRAVESLTVQEMLPRPADLSGPSGHRRVVEHLLEVAGDL